MMTERHRTMLRAICARPRTAREFTNAQHDALSPNACASHLNELVKGADRGQRGRALRGHRSRAGSEQRSTCAAACVLQRFHYRAIHRPALACPGWR